MIKKQLKKTTEAQQLYSKEALNLNSKQRLELLLKVKSYPIVGKRTSARQQIKEMIEFYNFCSIMLAQYFPNEKAEKNFIVANFIASNENEQSVITEEVAKALKMLNGYEALEKRVTAIQMLFAEYKTSFPELYELYNLEEYVTARVSDIIKETKIMINDEPQIVKNVLKRWGLLT